MTNQNTKTFKHFLNVFFALVIGFAMIAPASAQAYVFTTDLDSIPNVRKVIKDRREARQNKKDNVETENENREAREEKNSNERGQETGSLTR